MYTILVYIHYHLCILDGLAVLADRYRTQYQNARFKNISDQPYATNFYVPLTFAQRESRQKQKQLLTIAKQHRKTLSKLPNVVEITEMDYVSDRHLPLSLKLNKIYAAAPDNRTTNKIEELFILPNNKANIRSKSILIEGTPGIGKTELVKEIAYCWAKGEALMNIKLLIVLYLHDPKVQRINSIKMLIQLIVDDDLIDEDVAECAVEQLRDSQGSDVLFLMDSFDECHKKLHKNSFVMRLIERRVLSCSILFITSRPSGSYCLRTQVDQVFEIHGFDKESQSSFISHSLETLPAQQLKLENFLSSNPIISSYCFTPLYLRMLVFLFSQPGSYLPETAVEVIEKFILHTIYFNLNKSYKSKFNIPSKLKKMNELPKEAFELVCQFSKIAFEGVNTNQLVFTLEEMKKTCPKIENFIDGFGLLQAVEHYPETGAAGSEISLNFVHYTMQEFLAAYHISRLSEEEQYELLVSTHQEPSIFSNHDIVSDVPDHLMTYKAWIQSQYNNIWLIFASITGGESVALKKFVLKDFLQGEDKKMVLLFFQYYTEIKNEKMCQVLQGIFDDDNLITLAGGNFSHCHTSLFPHHMMFLVLLLSQSQGVHKSLKLTDIFISEDALIILGNYFQTNHVNVDCLCLENNNLKPSNAKIIGAIIKMNHLKTIAICENYFLEAEAKAVYDALSVQNSIHSLTLSNVGLSNNDICLLMDALEGKVIQNLDISDNRYGSEGLKAIATFVSACKTLSSLNLASNMIALTEEGIQYVLNLSQEDDVNVLSNHLYDFNGISALVDAFDNTLSLTSLDFAADLCPDKWCYKIAQALQKLKNLQSLNFCYLNLMMLTVKTIANITRSNKSLASLNIANNNIDNPGINEILDTLLYNKTLRLLDISLNELSFKCAIKLVQVLQNNSVLTCLALGSNKISDEGCCYLAKALSVNKTLTSLYIRDNMISDDGAKELASALQRNTSLLHLDLSFNDITDNGAMALMHALHINNCLKVLFIIFNDINDEDCLVSNQHFKIDDTIFALTNNLQCTVSLFSAQFVRCRFQRHILFTKLRYYNEWKQETLIESIQ